MKYIVKRAFCFSIACAPFVALPVIVSARTDTPATGVYTQLAQAQNEIGKSKAADIAKAAHGGKVLKVEETTRTNKKVYRVKLLLDGGRIKIVTVDGQSGRLL